MTNSLGRSLRRTRDAFAGLLYAASPGRRAGARVDNRSVPPRCTPARRHLQASARQSGYLLLPVAIAIALIGVIAFLISRQSAIEVELAAGELDTARAEYVAQAGLKHALRELAQQGCGPYTDLVNYPFGADEYDTLLSHDLGATTNYALSVDQDTWINQLQPDTNHGPDTKLSIEFDGTAEARALVRYDLSALPAKASILSAVAWFHVNGEHPEGPVEVHGVTADWTETDATWNSMNANLSAEISASVPPQPIAVVWVAVNLTSQVQAWVNGQPNYGIFLRSLAPGIKAKYMSRESSFPSYLEVIVGSPATSPTKLESTSKLDGGGAASIERDNVVLRQAPLSTRLLQPGPADGKDSYLYEWKPTWNYGAGGEIWVDDQWADSTAVGLIRFNLGAIPTGARVVDARLELYQTSPASNGGPVGIYRLETGWDEGTGSGSNGFSNWTQRTATAAWANPGGDFDSRRYALESVPAGIGWNSWEIGELVDGWVRGRYPNEGLALYPESTSTGTNFASSDHADPTLRPKLSVTYTCTCGEVCVAPQGSGNLLIVVIDKAALVDEEEKAIDLFESWGYTVKPISANAPQNAFNVEFGVHDVVFVSETVSQADLGGKLVNAPIGVVSQDGDYNPDLGFSGSSALTVGSAIDIISTDHYITRPFVAGPLEIYRAGMEQLTVNGAESADLETLARSSGAGSLVVLDTGDALEAGGSAAGRRVMLPLGTRYRFDWDYLDANGRLLVHRALAWAMDKKIGAGGSALWVSTGGNVSGSGAPGLNAWDNGEALAFGDPGLALEPPTTAGEFSSVINLENFSADVNLDALHYVGSDITVGGDNSVDLKIGDLLLSTSGNETLTSNNSITVNNEDVFVFRPDTPDDYSVGTFIFLIDGSQIHAENDTVGISLVEKDTAVGNGNLARGDFIMATTNRRDVQLFDVTDVGPGTTSGSLTEFIDGPTLGFGSEIRGLELAEDEIVLGGHTIPAGAILLTLNNDDLDGVGDNAVPADSADVFYLTVTTVGGSPVAGATLLFEGADVSLDTTEEHLQAVALNSATLPAIGAGPFNILFVVGNVGGPGPTTAEQDYKALLESWGHTVELIDDDATQAEFDTGVANNDVAFTTNDITASRLGTKLVDAAIGVVTAEVNLSDEFGLASTVGWDSGTQVEINDNSHYITQPLTLGLSTILSTSESLAYVSGTLSPDLAQLASSASGHGIVALDAGEQMFGGGSTAGRRVQLPWGGSGHDPNHLTADGLTILERAIEWGAGVGADTGPYAHWKLDDGAGLTAIDSAGGNDGTLTNGPTWSAGLLGDGLDFDGSNDYVDAGSFDVTGSGITLMTWFNADAIASDDPRFVSKASGTAEADAWWQLSLSDSGADRYLRMRIKAGGSTTTLADTTMNIPIGEWHLATATYDNATGEMKLYLDGVEIASRAHAVGGVLDTDPSVPVTLASNAGTARFFDGILDDVRVYNRALSATEIGDLYDAGAPPAAVSYTEAYQPWTAATPDNWETVDLAPFGVPPDAVVEVAVINEAISAERYGGVRAVGSTLDRRMLLHEAEAGGVDALTMHVQADAASQIQHYSDNTGQVSFVLLGYWTGASYTELFEPFSADASGSWVIEGLTNDGAGPNQIVEIAIYNINPAGERLGGVRPTGSSDERRFNLHEPEGGGRDFVTLMVETDASANIEVYAQSDFQVFFQLLGYWSTPPGSYTATGGSSGQVSDPASWQTIDLSSFGVPANSVTQFVLANENASLENSMRVREVGSTINNRGLSLQEAESGGSDLGSLHVNVNASAEVQWAAQRGASGGLFYPVGWWVLAP